MRCDAIYPPLCSQCKQASIQSCTPPPLPPLHLGRRGLLGLEVGWGEGRVQQPESWRWRRQPAKLSRYGRGRGRLRLRHIAISPDAMPRDSRLQLPTAGGVGLPPPLRIPKVPAAPVPLDLTGSTRGGLLVRFPGPMVCMHEGWDGRMDG